MARSLARLEKEIEDIKQRNRRVEIDKARETSFERKVLISVMTYFVISLFLLVSNVQNPWFNALIPTLAFVLSTFSLPFFRERWKARFEKGWN